jgi:DNA-binding transcriptional MerR regulator
MATVSEVARLLDVSQDTVKAWATRFAEYLSLTASTPKGKARQFNEADLRVLALVFEFWDDDPDFENIHAMLNSGEHNEERFVEFARLHTPIFQDVPDEIDETWQHGVLIGGMASRNWIDVAQSYKRAANSLVTEALKSDETHELDYPIVFLYRHCLKLYLKTMLGGAVEGHLLDKLIEALEKKYGKSLGGWIRDRLWDFHEIDRKSDMFRYPEVVSNTELWIDFHQIQLVMHRMTEAFERQIAHEATTQQVRP